MEAGSPSKVARGRSCPPPGRQFHQHPNVWRRPIERRHRNVWHWLVTLIHCWLVLCGPHAWQRSLREGTRCDGSLPYLRLCWVTGATSWKGGERSCQRMIKWYGLRMSVTLWGWGELYLIRDFLYTVVLYIITRIKCYINYYLATQRFVNFCGSVCHFFRLSYNV